MLVEFHPNINIQENGKTHYSLVPWTGPAKAQGLTLLTQNSAPLESTDTHDLNHIEARDRNCTKAEDLKRIEEARAAKCCTWKDCQSVTPFSSGVALKGHLEDHARDVIQRWSRDTECSWSGCVSKAKFKLLSPLRLHLENAHVKPLLCIRPGCSFKRPFRNISDLQRHVQTGHSRTSSFRCPYKECSSSARIFARKDKWLEHVQDAEHQLDNFCPVQHCEKEARSRCGFLSTKEAIKHMFNEHGGTSLDVRDFSCAIGGCEPGGPPYLTKDQLKTHLIANHSFAEVTLQVVLEVVEATEVHQVQEQLIPAGIKFDFCGLCLPPPPHPFALCFHPNKRSRFETIVYCCQCNAQHNPSIDFRCTYCPERPHAFCSNCLIQKIPDGGLTTDLGRGLSWVQQG
ncbi:hypothetical protein BGZ57DRAFT_958153 [Hyaloscypha finlandica]|nr:hypothetical protein BGZ57DRAFT_958153 [Hyaloscypha finlandica]